MSDEKKYDKVNLINNNLEMQNSGHLVNNQNRIQFLVIVWKLYF